MLRSFEHLGDGPRAAVADVACATLGKLRRGTPLDRRPGVARRALIDDARATSRATRSTPSSTASARTGRASRSSRSRGRAGVALVDPLTVDVAPLGELLGGPGLHGRARRRPGPLDPRARVRLRAVAAVRHAGRGRLHRHGHAVARVARRAAARHAAHEGRPPHRLDAPPAAASSSASTPRPTSSICSRCTTMLVARLEPMGRLEWATDECEERRQRIRTRPEPETAWWRIKGARQLRGTVARRRPEGRAPGGNGPRPALDVPPRFVLSDLALAGIVQPPAAQPRRPHRRSAASTAGLRDGTADDAARRGRRPASRSTRRRAAPARVRPDRPVARAGGDRARRVARAARVRARSRPRAARDPRRAHAAAAGSPEPARDGLARRSRRRAAPATARGEATIVLRDGGRRIELASSRRLRVSRPCRPSGSVRRMARFKVGVQLHPQATTVDELRAAWQRRRRARGRQHLDLGPLLPALRRSRRRALRGVHAARGDGGRHEPRAHRRARHVQLVPQPEPARRHGAHHRPHQRRAVRARHRRRAGSSATTTSTATSSAPRPPPARPRRDLPDHHGPLRPAHAAARAVPCRSSSAGPARRSRCGSSPSTPTRGTRSGRPRTTRRRTASSTSGARRLDRNPRQIERTVGIQRDRDRHWQAYLDAGAEHLIVMTGPPFDLAPVRRLLEIAAAPEANRRDLAGT